MNETLYFILALIPIAWLAISLCVLRWPGHIACPIGLAAAAALTLLFWNDSVYLLGTSVLEGVAFAAWPILLVVLAAIILFRYSEAVGDMEIIRGVLSGASADRRVLALICAWGFGGFLEGVAGFGTPVLIPGAILVALGFSPMKAVLICLVANTAPTPFAQIGIPAITLSGVTGLDAAALGAAVAQQILIPSLLLPFLIVVIAGDGVKALKGMIPVTLVSGLSFAVPVFALAFFMGPELPTLVGSVSTIICTVIAGRRLRHDGGGINKTPIEGVAADSSQDLPIQAAAPKYGAPQVLNACLPFILLFALVLLTDRIPAVHDALAGFSTKTAIYGGEGAYPLTFNWILTPGIMILAAVAVSCAIRRHSPRRLLATAGRVVAESRNMMITVVSIIAMAKVMSYGGMTAEIAIWLVAALGSFYPLIAPMIGMLGTFITGSDTTSCVLFGGLQSGAATAIGADPVWVAASNLSGASIGKMLSPQSIAVGLGIGGLDGMEGAILKRTFRYSLAFIAIICVVTFVGP
jgi:lactate permease